jgi:hypothetical protein
MHSDDPTSGSVLDSADPASGNILDIEPLRRGSTYNHPRTQNTWGADPPS